MIAPNAFVERLYKSTPILDAPRPAPFVGEAPKIGGGGGTTGSFTEAVSEAGKATMQALGKAEDTAMAGLAGQAEPHAVVEALAAAEMALQTAVSVRDKAVEAYQEILRMPV